MTNHKTLWLLECLEGKCGRIFLFYAQDEKDAETQTTQILAEHPRLTREKLRQQPHGFVIMHKRLPGHIIDGENTQAK